MSQAVVAGVSDPVGVACVAALVRDGHGVIALVTSADGRRRATDAGASVVHEDPTWSESRLLDVASDPIFGRGLAVLVNAHLLVRPGRVETAATSEWDRALEWMVLGPLMTTRAFIPALRRARGAVVHLGSVDAALGNPDVPMYSVAKGALTPLTHVMAHEFGPDGIRVTCVARAAVSGSGIPGADDDVVRPVVAATPLGRIAEPAEVADVVAYLASDRASFVTGAIVTVDGGRTATTHATGGRLAPTPPAVSLSFDPGAS